MIYLMSGLIELLVYKMSLFVTYEGFHTIEDLFAPLVLVLLVWILLVSTTLIVDAKVKIFIRNEDM